MPHLRRVEQPRRDRRPRARPRPRRRARRAGSAPPSPCRCATSATRPSRASRRRSASSTASSAAGSSRDRSSSLGGEPGIGKSTLLLQAAGRRSVGPVLYATGEESAAQVRLRADRLGLLDAPAGCRHRGPRRARRRADRRGRPVGAARRCSSSTRSRPRRSTSSTAPPGSVGQVRESTAAAHGARQGRGDRGRARRPRDQGRDDRRAEDAGAPRRRRASRSRASGSRRLRLVRVGQEPVRLDRRGRRLRDGRRRAARGRRPGPRLPGRPRRGGTRAASSRPTLEGSRPLLVEVQALVAPAGYGTPARKASGIDPNRLALLVAVLGRRAGIGLGSHDVYANLAGGLSVAEPGLDLPRRARPRLVAARPAGRRRRSRSARSACSASCARSPASSAGCARPPASGSTRRSCRAGPRRARRRTSRACGRRGRRPSATRSPTGLGDGPAHSWRCGPGDARLTPRPGLSGRTTETLHSRLSRLIRYIRLLGAALGGLVGLVLAGTGDGLFRDASYAGFLLAAWVVAWVVVGFAILPYLTVVPATWLISRVEDLSTAEFVTAVIGLTLGLLMGLLLGLPLANLPPPWGDMPAARRVAVPRARHARPDRRQAARPDHGRAGGRVPRPAGRRHGDARA